MGRGLYPGCDSRRRQVAGSHILFPVHRLALIAAAALVLLLAALPAAAAVSPGAVTVAVGETHTVATEGTTCTTHRPDGSLGGQCTDVAYPLPMHGSVTLKPRRRLRLAFAGRPSSVVIILRLRRVPESRSVYAAAAGVDSRNHHRFKALLPRRLPCAALLDILARGPAGETDYWARIHTPGCVRR